MPKRGEGCAQYPVIRNRNSNAVSLSWFLAVSGWMINNCKKWFRLFSSSVAVIVAAVENLRL